MPHRHRHHPPPPPHETLGLPPGPEGHLFGRHPVPPHLREAQWSGFSIRQRQLMAEIFDRPEESEAAADILATAPPEFAALSALVLGVYERLSREGA
jgi:hypothetical protein